MIEDFHDVLTEFVRSGARFLVVGAHALSAHGVPRATVDLDLWVAPDPDNADRVYAALAATLAESGLTIVSGLAFGIDPVSFSDGIPHDCAAFGEADKVRPASF